MTRPLSAEPRRLRAERERAREPLRGVRGLVARNPRARGERAHGLESHGLSVDGFFQRAELLARGDEDALHGVQLGLHGHRAAGEIVIAIARARRIVGRACRRREGKGRDGTGGERLRF